jgi:hypothetical protein
VDLSQLRELQVAAGVWRAHNFPSIQRDVWRQLSGVTEENGELNHAVLKMDQGIRGDKEKHMLDAEDAIGDLIIYLTGVCDSLNLNLDECINAAWSRVEQRDWTEDPEHGGE